MGGRAGRRAGGTASKRLSRTALQKFPQLGSSQRLGLTRAGRRRVRSRRVVGRRIDLQQAGAWRRRHRNKSEPRGLSVRRNSPTRTSALRKLGSGVHVMSGSAAPSHGSAALNSGPGGLVAMPGLRSAQRAARALPQAPRSTLHDRGQASRGIFGLARVSGGLLRRKSQKHTILIRAAIANLP